jgi:hypothetical protein
MPTAPARPPTAINAAQMAIDSLERPHRRDVGGERVADERARSITRIRVGFDLPAPAFGDTWWMEKALFFVNIVSAGVFVGVQLLVLDNVAPTIRKLDRPLGIQLHRQMLDHKEHLRLVMPATSLAISTAAILEFLDVDSTAKVLLGVGLVGMLGVSITTFAVNAPINVRFRTLTPDAPDYDVLVRRWDRSHGLRALSGVIAYAAFVAAALSS